jgi:hypothetical protein
LNAFFPFLKACFRLTGAPAAANVPASMRMAKTNYTMMNAVAVKIALRSRGAFWHAAAKQEEFI